MRYLLLLAVLLAAVSSLHADDVGKYESLAAAIKAIGTTETDLQVTDRQIVSAAVTVPANIRLVISRGGQLVKEDKGSITFVAGSNLEAGLYQIFSGFETGVTFNAGSVTAVYPEWWGAHPVQYGKPRPDSYAAFKAAFDSFGPSENGINNRGGRINLSNGDYYLSQTWVISKPCAIVGQQSALHPQLSITRLLFPENTTGIFVRTGYTTICDLAVQCLRKDKTGHGLDIGGTVYLERVNASGFAENGFNIVAKAAEGRNANCWSMTDCTAIGNGGDGLFVSGPDANAGVCTKFNGTFNGGWQIHDESLLGNTYIQCHAHAGSRKAYKTGIGLSVLVGCYAEMGQNSEIGPGTVTLGGVLGALDNIYPIVVITGDGNRATGIVAGVGLNGALTHILMTNFGSGYTKATVGIYPPSGTGAVLTPVITDGRITAVKIENGGTGYKAHTRSARIVPHYNGGFSADRIFVANRAAGSSRAADVILADRANTLLSFSALGMASPFDAFTWDENTGSFESKFRGATNSSGIRFVSDLSKTETGGRGKILPQGSVSFPNGFWIGGGANGRQQNTGTAAPVTGEHAQGDIVWNQAPSPGGFVGWVCIQGGTPGTWKGFGKIEL
ncbi:MAG: hypothetical protein WC551_13905 [Patescibacteria group bacterium]